MAAIAPQVLSKIASELLNFGIDFSGKMSPGELITAVDSVTSNDPLLAIAQPTPATQGITFTLDAGTTGEIADITAQVTTDAGQSLTAVVRLAVLDPTADGYPTGGRLATRLQYPYTSIIEMESILSIVGVGLRVDDNRTNVIEPSEGDNALDAIEEATETLNLYLAHRYNKQDLSKTSLVRRWASYLACHYLSIRRGQGSLYAARVEQITTVLEQVKEGSMIIPDLGTKEDFTPAMSNLTVDDRFAISKMRVEQVISTGGTSDRQDADIRVPHNQYWTWY